MKGWLVEVSADIPYPWSRTFRISRSSAGAAASEAVKRYRKALREEKGKSKKLDDLRLHIMRSDECDSE